MAIELSNNTMFVEQIDVDAVDHGSEFCSPAELKYIAKWMLTTNNETMRQLGQLEQIMVVDGLNEDARRPDPDTAHMTVHEGRSFTTIKQPAAMEHQASGELKIFV